MRESWQVYHIISRKQCKITVQHEGMWSHVLSLLFL